MRHSLPSPDPISGAGLTDVVGDLVEADEQRIVVDTGRGRVTVPRAAVVATRVIPPRASRRGAPHRALSIEDLERVMLGAWPPTEQQHLGEWVLRAAGGFTARANSALTIGHPDRPVPTALDDIGQWYAARALTPVLAVPLAPGLGLTDDDVAATALRSGWTAGAPVLVLTGATRQVVAAAQDSANRIEIETTPHVTEAWFATYARSRAASRADVKGVLEGSPTQWFAVARSASSAVVGVGRVGISSGWAGVGAMWVEPSERSRGIGTAVLHRLLTRAVEHGCVSTHLQVASGNAAATDLYRRLGYREHHRYTYLTRG